MDPGASTRKSDHLIWQGIMRAPGDHEIVRSVATAPLAQIASVSDLISGCSTSLSKSSCSTAETSSGAERTSTTSSSNSARTISPVLVRRVYISLEQTAM